jgi:hypothetical protein
MKTISTLAGCALVALFATSAFARTDVHVSINLGNAPPPPVVVVQHAPHTVWLPETRVYVSDDRDFDDDYFQCGAYWYSYHNGWWYRARTWRGPFAVIDAREVPYSIVVTPQRRWRHYPPGLIRGREAYYAEHRVPAWGPARDDWRDNGRGHDRGDNRDNGRGHGKGHDKHNKGHDRGDD